MKKQYIDHRFAHKSQVLIEKANEVIEEYSEMGYVLTLRQIYYQFVANKVMPNSKASYKTLTNIVTRAREAGLMSWTAIEDTSRTFRSFGFTEEISELVEDLRQRIFFDQWDRQDTYIEIWVEKEALANIVKRPANKYRVPWMACKGYLSASHAWRAGLRFKERIEAGKRGILIHLGDHDPSGMDMTRDNQGRLNMFSELGVEVHRIALNMDQIEQYKPPPDPVKPKDARLNGYLERYGDSSWELDALKPQILDKLITDKIESFIDFGSWNRIRNKERLEDLKVDKLCDRWEDVSDFLDTLDD